MNAPPSLSNLSAPVVPNWRHAFGGVWRLTFHRYLLPGRWLMVLAALAVLALLCAASSHRGDARYVEWTVEFYVAFLVPALAFLFGAGAMRDEMKSGTVDYVLTRPVRRPAFVVFKFIAHTVCAQLDFLFALAVVLGVGAFRDTPDLAAAVPGLLLGQMLMITVAGALGFLSGVLTSRYVVIGILYAGVVEVGLGQIPTQLSRLSMTRQIRDLLEPIGGGVAPAAAAVGTAGLLLLFAGLAVAAAAAIFNLREIGASPES